MTHDPLYRRGVGVMLINADNLVWVGRRIDNRDEAWQMPQGGLDKGEAPWAGALRELEEETGIAPRLVEKIADHPQQLKYDIPDAIALKLWKGRFKGQVQDWYLARFLGDGRRHRHRHRASRILALAMGRAALAPRADRAVQARHVPRDSGRVRRASVVPDDVRVWPMRRSPRARQRRHGAAVINRARLR